MPEFPVYRDNQDIPFTPDECQCLGEVYNHALLISKAHP